MDVSTLSLIVAVLEASNKKITAPMRQEWINKLRELSAELISSAQHYYVAGFEDRTDEEYQRLTLLQAHIRLMLNSNEEDHRRLEKLTRRIVTELEKAKIDEFPDLLVELATLSRKILKREWDRVKEPILAETSRTRSTSLGMLRRFAPWTAAGRLKGWLFKRERGGRAGEREGGSLVR